MFAARPSRRRPDARGCSSVRVTAIAVAALMVAAVTGGCAGRDPHGLQPAPGNWRLAWSDEFIGPAGNMPNPAIWRPDTGGDGWGNSELQTYTADPANAALDGHGHLAIIARTVPPETGTSSPDDTCWYGPCRFTSARLTTQGTLTHQYGMVAARIQVPSGPGLWPAFWMLGDANATLGWPNSGEIDVMECLGHDPRTVYGALHGPGAAYRGNDGVGGSHRLPPDDTAADGFHTYAVTWSRTAISWYVDGHRYITRTPAETGQDGWVFDHPFFLLLNLAVGGTWPGDPTAATAFPATMLVDYVRLYDAA
jgi:beta-glucanase (GH16 family)